MNGKVNDIMLKFIHKKKPKGGMSMDEIEKKLREIMDKENCSPLFALFLLVHGVDYDVRKI